MVTGLYTVLLPLVGFALFGSSRHLVVAADSATAAIFSSALSRVAPAASEKYMALVGMLTLLTALLLLLARVFKLGMLADFLSRTALVGFLTVSRSTVFSHGRSGDELTKPTPAALTSDENGNCNDRYAPSEAAEYVAPQRACGRRLLRIGRGFGLAPMVGGPERGAGDRGPQLAASSVVVCNEIRMERPRRAQPIAGELGRGSCRRSRRAVEAEAGLGSDACGGLPRRAALAHVVAHVGASRLDVLVPIALACVPASLVSCASPACAPKRTRGPRARPSSVAPRLDGP